MLACFSTNMLCRLLGKALKGIPRKAYYINTKVERHICTDNNKESRESREVLRQTDGWMDDPQIFCFLFNLGGSL